MRFKEFVNEEQFNAAAHIEQHCGVYLSAMRNAFDSNSDGVRALYRGEHNQSGHTNIGTIRTDRRPVQMSKQAHHILQDCYLDFGLKATRTNSIFCSTSRDIAYMWADDVFMIFPYDGWTATAYDEDLNGYMYSEITELPQYVAISHDAGTPELIAEFKAGVNGLLTKHSARNVSTATSMADVLRGHHADVMITGTNYVRLSINHRELLTQTLSDLGLK